MPRPLVIALAVLLAGLCGCTVTGPPEDYRLSDIYNHGHPQ